jgi:hypothetical protein
MANGGSDIALDGSFGAFTTHNLKASINGLPSSLVIYCPPAHLITNPSSSTTLVFTSPITNSSDTSCK